MVERPCVTNSFGTIRSCLSFSRLNLNQNMRSKQVHTEYEHCVGGIGFQEFLDRQCELRDRTFLCEANRQSVWLFSF